MDREDYYEIISRRILAIFPQKTFHHNAYIIGGRDGLTALRDALNEVLDEPDAKRSGICKTAMVHAQPGDDETYTTFVQLDYDLADIERNPKMYSGHDLPCPYYDQKAVDAYAAGAVSLSPTEGHIMAAGVANHLFVVPNDEPVVAEKPKRKRKKKG